jgi:hypothetical protein
MRSNLGDANETIAVATYVLEVIGKKLLNLDLSLHAMLQILSMTPFGEVPLLQLLTDLCPTEETASPTNQLSLL